MYKNGVFIFFSWSEIKINGYFNKVINVFEILFYNSLLSCFLFLFYFMNFLRVEEDFIGTFLYKFSCIYFFYVNVCLL